MELNRHHSCIEAHGLLQDKMLSLSVIKKSKVRFLATPGQSSTSSTGLSFVALATKRQKGSCKQ